MALFRSYRVFAYGVIFFTASGLLLILRMGETAPKSTNQQNLDSNNNNNNDKTSRIDGNILRPQGVTLKSSPRSNDKHDTDEELKLRDFNRVRNRMNRLQNEFHAGDKAQLEKRPSVPTMKMDQHLDNQQQVAQVIKPNKVLDLETLGLIKTHEDDVRKRQGYEKYAFNLLVSDRIGERRDIPDSRAPLYVYSRPNIP